MDISALERKRDEAKLRAKGIYDAAVAAGRELSAEETSVFDAAMTEAEAAQASIESITNQRSRLDAIDAARNASAGRKSGPSPAADSGGRSAREENKPRVEVIEDDTRRGFKTPRDYLSTVMDWERGRKKDARLAKLVVGDVATLGTDEQQGSANQYGGFLLPTAFSPNLQKVDPEADPMGAAITRVPMSAPSISIPARVDKDHSTSVSGGTRFYRRTETIAATTSRVALEMITMKAETLTGAAFATEEILQDSAISFVSIIEQGFAEELTATLVNERINGTGAGGQFLGILTALASASNGPTISIAKESDQTAATINFTNIKKMRARCWRYGQAVWLANHDTLPDFLGLSQAVGVGGSMVWQPSAIPGQPDTLLGRPIIFTEYCKTLGTQGDIILGVWSQYMEATYAPMQSAESIHVRFLENERAFKFNVRNAGAPWWRSALTPKNSTATLSPFVVLDTRA